MANKFAVQIGNNRFRLCLFMENGAKSTGYFTLDEMAELQEKLHLALSAHRLMTERQRLDSEELYKFPAHL